MLKIMGVICGGANILLVGGGGTTNIQGGCNHFTSPPRKSIYDLI